MITAYRKKLAANLLDAKPVNDNGVIEISPKFRTNITKILREETVGCYCFAYSPETKEEHVGFFAWLFSLLRSGK